MNNVAREKEKRGFETEVKQLLHLMIHALYSNKEIFLRELISNASDAIDKLRFEAISHPDRYEGNTDLHIEIAYDKEAKTIIVRDNGIGMSREEVISHLGTIAKSGTQAFLKSLTGEEAKDRHLIGQFGVGFYSSFIVADKVTVNTRRAGLSSEEGVCWESEGEGDYTVETIEKADRGTEIILHLKSSEEEFLHAFRLQHIVTKYADHLNVPVLMKTDEKAEKVEVINRATALWVLPKNDIQEQDYIEFYKHVAHDFEDPLLWSHNRVEGKLEYIMLLYVPGRAPFDLWQQGKPRGLKLYVKRVFIMDQAEQFLPNYLRFVRGVIDSSDLPLNISREILQNNRVVDTIRSAVIKRVLSMLSDLAKTDSEKYQTFWKEFGQVLKEGPAEDFANKEMIAELLRFASTHTDEEIQNISLDAYIERMKPDQDKIYYVAADTFNAAKNSPHLEIFRAKGVEVLLLNDRIDEWLISHLTQYKEKPFQSVAVGTLEGVVSEKEKDEDKEKTQQANFEEILEKVKEVLGKKVKAVRLTHRLTTSPACIVAEEGQMTTQMQRILRSAGQTVSVEPILELNPEHLLVQQLKKETDSTCFSDLSYVLFDQAILAEGGQLDDPATFIKRFNALLLNMAKNGSPSS